MSEDIQMIYTVVCEIRDLLRQIKDRILVREEVKMIKAENLPMTETIEQDLTNVTFLFETEKSVLAFKNGYQIWIAKQYIKGGYNTEKEKPQDIELTDKGKWILKKNWEPYVPYKEGK